MEFFRVLRESLKVLLNEPKIFVPRIATTVIYSFFIFYSAKLSFELSFALARESQMPFPDVSAALGPYMGEITFVALASFVCLYLFS